jgi:DNA-binding transcriptional regulator YdaS (Cro superfamily)
MKSDLKQRILDKTSFTAIADATGVSVSAVSHWFRRETGIPAERVLTLESLSGISRYELRPDIYPLDQLVISPRRKRASVAAR